MPGQVPVSPYFCAMSGKTPVPVVLSQGHKAETGARHVGRFCGLSGPVIVRILLTQHCFASAARFPLRCSQFCQSGHSRRRRAFDPRPTHRCNQHRQPRRDSSNLGFSTFADAASSPVRSVKNSVPRLGFRVRPFNSAVLDKLQTDHSPLSGSTSRLLNWVPLHREPP